MILPAKTTGLASLAAAFCLGLATARGGTTVGSCLEYWELVNFQPGSETFEQPVRSSSYHPRTTVIMLLSAG